MSTTNSDSTRVLVVGAAGRMGAMLCAAAQQNPDFQLVAAITAHANARDQRRSVGHDESSPLLQTTVNTDTYADVVIDFSSDAGTQCALRIAQQTNAALLIGTTAISERTRQQIIKTFSQRAVLVAPNTSLGVATLRACAKNVARALGDAFECSIVESHHKHKKDAPSGTALALAQDLRSAGAHLESDQIHALRGGEVVGEHTVRFAGPGEYIELTHRALSRDVFVHGALIAAAWLKDRAPGSYSMEDVLGLGASS
jgi:4-hydroxy-tetrahydrodipicolinate reductase